MLEKAGAAEYVFRGLDCRKYREALIVEKALVVNLAMAVGKVDLIEQRGE